MFNSAVGRVRLAGMIEGTSFLILLLVAMPLKYLANQPKRCFMSVGFTECCSSPMLRSRSLRGAEDTSRFAPWEWQRLRRSFHSGHS